MGFWEHVMAVALGALLCVAFLAVVVLACIGATSIWKED